MAFGDAARRRPQSIERDFDALFRYMRSKRFRNGEDTGGEPADYIYAYHPEKELEVARRIPLLVSRLQGMDPVDADDTAPAVLVIDLYELAMQVMKDDDVFDAAVEQEPDMHGDEEEGVDGDEFYQALANMLDPDGDGLKDALKDRYRRANEHDEADLVFVIGVGRVYPYIRAHALLASLQKIMPEHTPVVLFFPGTYEKTASTVSVMRLFDRLEADNYYRAFSLNTAIQEGADA
ncbi:DUF1788 domain-containing protein [Bifidobacterium platyrrhinorum]|nr:DUF1788 domain-containing protein [Bifidobacterium platyrrhinorum]